MFSFPWRYVILQIRPPLARSYMPETRLHVACLLPLLATTRIFRSHHLTASELTVRTERRAVYCTKNLLSPHHSLPAVTLSQDGRELWTATEGNGSGGVSVTGYRRVTAGEKWQWQLTHSFAALSGLSREAQTSRMVLHLLPASKCIAVVCSNGLLCVLCVEDTAAPPLRVPLVCPAWLRLCPLSRTQPRTAHHLATTV